MPGWSHGPCSGGSSSHPLSGRRGKSTEQSNPSMTPPISAPESSPDDGMEYGSGITAHHGIVLDCRASGLPVIELSRLDEPTDRRFSLDRVPQVANSHRPSRPRS